MHLRQRWVKMGSCCNRDSVGGAVCEATKKRGACVLLCCCLSLREQTSKNETDPTTLKSDVSYHSPAEESPYKKNKYINFSLFQIFFFPPPLLLTLVSSGLFLPLGVASLGFPCHHHVSCHWCAGTRLNGEKALTLSV